VEDCAGFEIPSEKASGSWDSQLPERFLGNWWEAEIFDLIGSDL